MLTLIQQKLLQMMKEIDEVCRENDIHYSLGGGTAIGAIRHRGFIPWDDDIDLYMTRDNWEKFKAAGREGKLPENRVIESAETDIEYTNTFGRYVTTDSSAVHEHQMVNEDPAGHVIDVFVFDPLHIDNYWAWLEDYMLYSDLVDESKSYSTRYDFNIDRYEKYLERCSKEGKQAVVGELIESFTHMDKPGWQHYIMEWGAAHFLFPASIFDGGYTRVPFEDTTVEIVKNFSEYLTWQYGDEWEYIPKHDGREGHDAIFSNEIPYTVVRDDYRDFVDFAEVRKAYIRRKKRLLKANQHRRSAQAAELNNRATNCAKALGVKLEKEGLDASQLKSMLADGKYNELAEIFRDYYDVQLSAEMIGRKDKHSKLRMYLFPQLVALDAEVFAIALETLVRTERMSKARRLIDVYEQCHEKIGMNCDAAVDAIREEIDEARELINRYSLAEAGDRNLMDALDAYIEKYPRSSQIKRLKLRMLLEIENSAEEDAVEAKRLLLELKNMLGDKHSAYGELLKYHADIDRLESGLDETVIEKYLEAYKLTENGFIRLEIEDLLGREKCCLVGDEEEPALAAAPVAAKESKGLYGIAKNIYRKIAGKDDNLKARAWEIVCRTRDRVVLLEKYEPMLEELEALEKAGKWQELGEVMADHEAAVLRNLGLELGLAVHPTLTRIQNELFEKSGRAETAERVERLIPEQHRKPIGH